MIKKSPKQIEKENILIRKKEADQKWDEIIKKLNSGEKVSFFVISQSMNECNAADYALMQRGFSQILRHNIDTNYY